MKRQVLPIAVIIAAIAIVASTTQGSPFTSTPVDGSSAGTGTEASAPPADAEPVGSDTSTQAAPPATEAPTAQSEPELAPPALATPRLTVPTPPSSAVLNPKPTATSPAVPAPTPAPAPEPTPAATQRPQTIVSLTFDDANADQLAAANIMNGLGIRGTFYIPSGYVGANGYLTQADLVSLANSGQEIGGHTVTHANLTALPLDEVKRQVCNDRVTLASWGFDIRSFAYPFAETNASVETAVEECGYTTARMLGDIKSRFGCADCDYVESPQPSNPYYTRALDQVDNTWTLKDFKTAVTNAERTGGWLQFTFHNICTTSCGELSVTESLFTQFTTWLAARSATRNTITLPVGDVVGGPVRPLVSGPAATSGTGITNPGLENPGSNGSPECWFQAPYGTNTAVFSTVTPGHSGAVASKITMSGYVSGDAKLLPTFDLGSCAPGATEGHTYALESWYTSTTVTQFAVYLRTTSGSWQYWTSSPWFAGSASWALAQWTTPEIPVGYTGISFGLNIFSDGELVTDDYAISDNTPAPVAVAPAVEPEAALAPEAVEELPAESPVDPPAEPSREAIPPEVEPAETSDGTAPAPVVTAAPAPAAASVVVEGPAAPPVAKEGDTPTS